MKEYDLVMLLRGLLTKSGRKSAMLQHLAQVACSGSKSLKMASIAVASGVWIAWLPIVSGHTSSCPAVSLRDSISCGLRLLVSQFAIQNHFCKMRELTMIAALHSTSQQDQAQFYIRYYGTEYVQIGKSLCWYNIYIVLLLIINTY